MEYKKFRWFFTSSGKLVIGGKNAEQNEQIINQHLNKNDLVLHTKSAGSPFCVIKGKASKKDIVEAAVFCARYSKEWKKEKRKKDVEVHYFKGKNVYKDRKMKIGTFGVKKFKAIKVKKEDIEK